MGFYSHYTNEQLAELRDRLSAAYEQRLTGPNSATGHGRSVQFQHESTEHLARQISAINEELNKRNGKISRRPIYLV
jgi:hypothetical protein